MTDRWFDLAVLPGDGWTLLSGTRPFRMYRLQLSSILPDGQTISCQRAINELELRQAKYQIVNIIEQQVECEIEEARAKHIKKDTP